MKKYVIPILFILIFVVWMALRKNPEQQPRDSKNNGIATNKAAKASQLQNQETPTRSRNPINRGPSSAERKRQEIELMLTKSIRSANMTTIAMGRFADDFDGELPSEDTWKELQELTERTSIDSPMPRKSDWYLQQLLTKQLLENEGVFHLPVSGDNQTGPNLDGVIQPGENSFSYVPRLLRTDHSQIPLLLAPLVPGTLKFDRDALGGKAVVVRLNNLVETYDINEDGTLAGEGAGIFDHGEMTVWGNEPVTPSRIAYPETAYPQNNAEQGAAANGGG